MKKYWAVWGLVVLAGSGGARAESASESSTQSLVALKELQGYVVTNKSTYILGEPVYLKLVFSNWSEKNAFEVEGYLHPANDFEIHVSRANEISRRYTAGVRKEVLLPMTRLRLRQREISVLRWSLCYEPERPKGFLFDRPGEYSIKCQVRASVLGAPLIMPLPSFSVQIVEPPADQKPALELVMRSECAEDLQRLQTRDETEALWQDVAARFPKSLWAPYAKMLLARRLTDKTPEQSAQAAEQFQAILRDYPDFPLRDDLCYFCALCQDRLAKPVDALRWLTRLQREFPTSPYIQADNRLFHKYIYQDGWERRYAPWYVRE